MQANNNYGSHDRKYNKSSSFFIDSSTPDRTRNKCADSYNTRFKAVLQKDDTNRN